MNAQPRPTQSTLTETRRRFLPSALVVMVAGVILAFSYWLPYWEMKLVTPAQPQGMQLVSYLHHLEGPLDSTLAHSGPRGQARLQDLQELELSLVVAMVTAVGLLLIAATFICRRWSVLLTVPALFFPVIVVADTTRLLFCITATLSATGGPLPAHPTLFMYGRLAVGGVALEIYPGTGMFLALASSIIVLSGLWLHYKAHRTAVRGTSMGAMGSGFVAP